MKIKIVFLMIGLMMVAGGWWWGGERFSDNLGIEAAEPNWSSSVNTVKETKDKQGNDVLYLNYLFDEDPSVLSCRIGVDYSIGGGRPVLYSFKWTKYERECSKDDEDEDEDDDDDGDCTSSQCQRTEIDSGAVNAIGQKDAGRTFEQVALMASVFGSNDFYEPISEDYSTQPCSETQCNSPCYVVEAKKAIIRDLKYDCSNFAWDPAAGYVCDASLDNFCWGDSAPTSCAPVENSEFVNMIRSGAYTAPNGCETNGNPGGVCSYRAFYSNLGGTQCRADCIATGYGAYNPEHMIYQHLFVCSDGVRYRQAVCSNGAVTTAALCNQGAPASCPAGYENVGSFDSNAADYIRQKDLYQKINKCDGYLLWYGGEAKFQEGSLGAMNVSSENNRNFDMFTGAESVGIARSCIPRICRLKTTGTTDDPLCSGESGYVAHAPSYCPNGVEYGRIRYSGQYAYRCGKCACGCTQNDGTIRVEDKCPTQQSCENCKNSYNVDLEVYDQVSPYCLRYGICPQKTCENCLNSTEVLPCNPEEDNCDYGNYRGLVALANELKGKNIKVTYAQLYEWGGTKYLYRYYIYQSLASSYCYTTAQCPNCANCPGAYCYRSGQCCNICEQCSSKQYCYDNGICPDTGVACSASSPPSPPPQCGVVAPDGSCTACVESDCPNPPDPGTCPYGLMSGSCNVYLSGCGDGRQLVGTFEQCCPPPTCSVASTERVNSQALNLIVDEVAKCGTDLMAGTLELGADGYQVIYSERASDNYISMTPEQYDRYKNESGKNIGDFRGKISCRQDIVSAPVMVELQDQGYLCTTGGDVCIQSQYFDWREMRLSCEEINPDYPDEYRGFAYFGNPACQNEGLIGVINSLLTPDQKAKFLASCNDADLDFYRLTSGTVIFIPDKEGNAGPHGFRCGKYYNLSPEAVPDPNWCGGGETGCPPQAENHYTAPWLGFAGGNVYAQAGIKMAATDSHINNQAGGDGHQNYVVDNLSDSGNVCSRTAGKRAGLLATGINGEIAITDGFLTHRGTYGGVENKVSAEKAFPSLERRDFHYYKAQVNYESVSVCPNYSVISDSKVCKIVVGGKRTDLTLPSDIASDDKIVIFLEFTDEVKELEINSGLAAKLRAPTNGYLALITNGLVTIGSTVGTYLSDGACRTVTNKSADLQLVLIANELKFSDYGRYEPDPFFNPKRYCDLQLTMAGNFVTWKGNIAFNRELSGCGILRAEQESQGLQTSSTNGEQYRDAYLNLSYNSASTLVFPRSDLIERTPEWMREAKSLRMTTQ